MKKVIIGVLLHIIIPCIIIIAVLLVLNTTDIISLDGLTPVTVLAGDEDSYSGPKSASKEAMLQSCEEIAKFDSENGYTYNSESPPWDTHYKDGQYKTTCCSIFVLQVFVDIGLTDSLGDLDAAYVGTFCESHPEDWQEFVARSEADLEPGDVQVYVHHTNIFAGFNADGIRRVLGCRRYKRTDRGFYRSN